MDKLFSFDYGGRPFPEGFERSPQDAEVWAHPSGLTVTAESTFDPDAGALEWTLWFENRGKAGSAPLTNVYPLDARAAFPDGCTVTTAKGTSGEIDDFALVTDALAAGAAKEYASCGSRAYIPFFNVGGEHAGAVCAVGWTGRWFAKVEAHAGGARVTGGMPSTGFHLRPGERVRTPRVLWMPWTGRRLDAHNALRRHLAKKMPKGADGQPQAPICFGTWGGMKTATHKKLIEFIQKQGFRYDLYWIDAGWYGDDHETEEFQNFANEDWYFHVGNWRVNRKVHPNGLRPVTDAAHAAGMKVLLWFHSLDCHSHLGWYKDHPEWGRITWDGIAPCVTKLFKEQNTRAKVASAYLDDPEAYKSIADTIGGLLKEHGADCYREDTSMPCGHPDEPGRDGIGEMKAVENYYAFWDSLRAQNPGLLIDSCGGGGTHIDLETVARSYVLHRSDYNCYAGADPIGSQVGNHGLGHFVPLPCGGMDGAGDSYAFRSSLNGGKAFSFELKFDQAGKALIGELEGYPFDWHRRMLDEFQTVKPCLWGDFYPLTDCDTATDRMLAYQLARPDLGSGVIFAFRRQDCETAALRVTPEIEKGVRYVLEDIEGGKPTTVTGGDPFEIAIAGKRDSRLILYRPEKVMTGKPLDPERRLRWFKEARFGMFVHWGLYSQLGRWEWTMHNERIPLREYEKLADTWQPKARCMRQWARLAQDAGMKYLVMTTKHHEGFCLWDSAQTGYNAARRGPGRDLVREYVDACREFGLKVGLYYSLMDWHHPDGMRAAKDPAAAGRFREFSHNCVQEFCSNYGHIDILWYDNAWPNLADGGWQPERLNAMVRRLQPQILINNRSGTPEDFGTPEGHVTAEQTGRAWEACMTMNGAWGYVPSSIDWVSLRQILEMLRTAAAGGGNLLLNIGPRADGSVPREASTRLRAVGRWIARHGEALYGPVERTDGLSLMNTGNWTLKGKTAYFWASRWPDTGEIVVGCWEGKVKQATLLTTGKPVRVEQVGSRLFLRGLPTANPDRVALVPVIKLECATRPRQAMDWSYEDPEGVRHKVAGEERRSEK